MNNKPKGLAVMIAIGKPKDNMNSDQSNQDQGAPDEGSQDSQMSMDAVNVVHLPQDAYPDAQDGDQVTTQISGKLMIGDDGEKHLMVEQADGKDVVNEGDQQAEGSPEEESGETQDQENAEPQANDLQSAKAGLMNAIKSKGGYANPME